MQTYRNPKKVCAQIGLGLFTMLLSWIILSAIFSIVFINQIASGSGIVLWLINDIPLYFVSVPVFLLFMKYIPDGAEPERRPMKMNVGRYLLLLAFCLGATYLLSYVGLLITELVNLIKGGSNGGLLGLDSLVDKNNIIVNLFFGAVVPAFGEEFVFRYMIRRKMKGSGDKTYMIFSALSFALFHVNHIQGLYAFVIGLALAWIYLRTGKLWYAISLHFIINTLGLVLFPLLTELENGEIIAGLIMLVLIITAIVLFFVFFKRVRNSLLPPSEPGWPNKSRYPLQNEIPVGANYGAMQQQPTAQSAQPFGRPYFSYSNLLPVQRDGKTYVSYNNIVPEKIVPEKGNASQPMQQARPAAPPESGQYAYNNMPAGQAASYGNMPVTSQQSINTNSNNTANNYRNAGVPTGQPPLYQAQPPFYQGQPPAWQQAHPAGYGAQVPYYGYGNPQYNNQPMPTQQVPYNPYGGAPYYSHQYGQQGYTPYQMQYVAPPQPYIPPQSAPYPYPYQQPAQPPMYTPAAYMPGHNAYGGNPYANGQGAYPLPPAPYGYAPGAYKKPTMASVCFLNVGMILYMVLAGIMILATMATL